MPKSFKRVKTDYPGCLFHQWKSNCQWEAGKKFITSDIEKMERSMMKKPVVNTRTT